MVLTAAPRQNQYPFPLPTTSEIRNTLAIGNLLHMLAYYPLSLACPGWKRTGAPPNSEIVRLPVQGRGKDP